MQENGVPGFKRSPRKLLLGVDANSPVKLGFIEGGVSAREQLAELQPFGMFESAYAKACRHLQVCRSKLNSSMVNVSPRRVVRLVICATGTWVTTKMNSSPPSRPQMSDVRVLFLRMAANRLRTSSPAR